MKMTKTKYNNVLCVVVVVVILWRVAWLMTLGAERVIFLYRSLIIFDDVLDH